VQGIRSAPTAEQALLVRDMQHQAQADLDKYRKVAGDGGSMPPHDQIWNDILDSPPDGSVTTFANLIASWWLTALLVQERQLSRNASLETCLVVDAAIKQNATDTATSDSAAASSATYRAIQQAAASASAASSSMSGSPVPSTDKRKAPSDMRSPEAGPPKAMRRSISAPSILSAAQAAQSSTSSSAASSQSDDDSSVLEMLDALFDKFPDLRQHVERERPDWELARTAQGYLLQAAAKASSSGQSTSAAVSALIQGGGRQPGRPSEQSGIVIDLLQQPLGQFLCPELSSSNSGA